MFSKPIRNFFVGEEEEPEKSHPPTPTNWLQQYQADSTCLAALKSPELRQILKQYKTMMNFKSGRIYSPAEFHFLKDRFKLLYDFTAVGTKPKLLERIYAHFEQHRHATVIQKTLRGYFARLALRLRGPALRQRSLCVNEQDGCTLEPLHDICVQNFFSYKDRDNFVYGFELSSIIQMMTISTSKCMNPFNRARMESQLPKLKILIRLTCMTEGVAYPYFVVLPKPKYVPTSRLSAVAARSGTPPLTMIMDQSFLPEEYNVENMIHHMREMRSHSFADRVTSLFMEMDQLGHYTNPSWFTALEGHGVTRYLRYLQDFWTYRSHLSQELKLRICPLWDPFISLLRGASNLYELSEEHVRNMCLSVMEDMVFTGVDVESRILGSFQVLTCLTLVSHSARQSMYYLYESVSY
jgi:hypothetical protein